MNRAGKVAAPLVQIGLVIGVSDSLGSRAMDCGCVVRQLGKQAWRAVKECERSVQRGASWRASEANQKSEKEKREEREREGSTNGVRYRHRSKRKRKKEGRINKRKGKAVEVEGRKAHE